MKYFVILVLAAAFCFALSALLYTVIPALELDPIPLLYVDPRGSPGIPVCTDSMIQQALAIPPAANDAELVCYQSCIKK